MSLLYFSCRLSYQETITNILIQVPHPLLPKFELRVQTDGEITPKDAVIAACHDLVKDLGILSREFTKEYELRKMVGSTQQQQNGIDGQ